MLLICTLTGAQVETFDDENARILIDSGVFVSYEAPAADEPKAPRKKKSTAHTIEVKQKQSMKQYTDVLRAV